MLNTITVNKMKKEELISFGRLNGILLSDEDTKSEISRKVLDVKQPEVSTEGVIKYARMIKYGSKFESGNMGAVRFLQTIHPSLSYEEAKRRTREIQRTISGK